MREELNELLRLIENSVKASEALRELQKRGLDTEVVLEDLFLFCGGTAAEIGAQLEKDKRFSRELIEMADLLEHLARRVEIIAPKLEETFPITIHVPKKYDVVQCLRNRADLYRKLVAAYYGPYLKNVRIGGKEACKANITSGRDHHLLHLMYLVIEGKKPKPVGKGQTPESEPKGKKPKQVRKGKKPKLEHYKLVAPLVAAVTGDNGDLHHIIDSLRKRFDRFASRGSKKDRRRLKLDKRTIEVSVREEMKKRRRISR